MTLRSFLVLLLAWLAMAPLVARAQPDADRERARELYHQGNDKYASGDYQGALDAFAAADAIMRVPTTALGLGKAQAALGLLLEAHQTLVRASQYPRADDEPPSFTEARSEATTLAPQIEAKIPVLTLEVSGVASGVPLTVGIDGATVAEGVRQEVLEHKLNPGSHRITVSAPGYRMGTAGFSVAEGDQKVVGIVLAKVEPGPRPAPAPEENGVDAVWIAAGVSFAIGGAGIIAGAITGGMSLSLASDVDALCGGDDTCPESARADHDDTITLANVSNACFAIGGAGLVAGLIAVIVAVTSESGSDGGVSFEGDGIEVRF